MYITPILAVLSVLVTIFILIGSNSSNNGGGKGLKIAKNKSTQQSVTPKKGSKTTASKTNIATNVTTTTMTDNTLKSPQSLISERECSFTPLIFFLVLIFYFLIFHSLANLPLGDNLLYGVHQRFWMQPNIIMFILAGIGYNYAFNGVIKMVNMFSNTSKTLIVNGKDKQSNSSVINTTDGGDENGNSWSIPHKIICILGYSISIILLYIQYSKWYTKMNYSDNIYFKHYATAILAPLPQNAILLINYDQQWTSIRYLQKCEHYRTDIIAIQLSMMTYKWFQEKRSLYPELIFPGTYTSHIHHIYITIKSILT